MVGQRIQIFIKVWGILKQFYPHPFPLLLLISFYLMSISAFSIGLPYLLKLLVDQTQLGQAETSFARFFQFNYFTLVFSRQND